MELLPMPMDPIALGDSIRLLDLPQPINEGAPEDAKGKLDSEKVKD